MTKKEIGLRFKYIRLKNKMTQIEFGNILGVSQPKIRDVERGHLSLTIELATILQEKFNADLLWLLFNKEGPKTIEDRNAFATLEKDYDSVKDGLTLLGLKEKSSAKKKYYETFCIRKIEIDKIFFKRFTNIDDLKLIEINGNAMSPTLNNGDFVMVQECNKYIGEGIYILQSDDIFLARRLQLDLDRKNMHIFCDNSFFKTEILDFSMINNIQIVGMVKANMSFF